MILTPKERHLLVVALDMASNREWIFREGGDDEPTKEAELQLVHLEHLFEELVKTVDRHKLRAVLISSRV